jgi:hypothetical protein
MTKRDPKETYLARRKLAHILRVRPLRAGPNGEPCEGQAFKPHKCSANIQLNEVIYPRNEFQKMPHEKQMYFWHEINCALNCETFHTRHGHTTEYRDWHIGRMRSIYGWDAVDNFIRQAPFKVNPRRPTA